MKTKLYIPKKYKRGYQLETIDNKTKSKEWITEKRENMAYNETYEEFVEKFKPKSTTDDCYTPPEVYKLIKDWVVKVM